ncbi:MAG: hypothetical protein H7Y15_03885, partial [Pseudonocardia sp.]|nr:hypothetical protein [Pseudonocardia sp.]
ARAIADLLRRRAAERPLLLVLEDVHWADEDTLALLEFVAADLTGADILVVVTFRETVRSAPGRLVGTLGVLARLPGADRVALRGLGPTAVAAMLRAHGGGVVAPGLAEAVHRRTGGNPFYITQLLRAQDSADLVADGPVPTGVRDVVRGRVARLPAPTRALRDTAALVARDVELHLLERVCGLDHETCLSALEPALDAGLLAPVLGRPGVYRVVHALVQESLVDLLPPLGRARLHERIAAALADAHPDDDEYVAEIADHLWSALPAGDTVRAVRAQARAGELAWTGLAFGRAETLLERAAELLRSLPPADAPPDVDLGVHIRLGSIRSSRHGHTDEARAAFARARALAEQLGRHGDLLPALWGLSAAAVVRGDLSTATELTEAALDQARHVPGRAGRATGEQGIGIVDFYLGRLAAARRRFAASLTLSEDTRGADPVALRGPQVVAQPEVMACCYDALAAHLQGDAAGADRQITRAARTATATGEPYAEAFVHSFSARLAVLRGDPATALVAGGRAIGIAEEHGFPLITGHAAIPIGWARARAGEPEAGLATIESGLAALHRSGQRVLTPFHRGLQAEVHLLLHDPSVALALLGDGLTESAARGGGFEAPGLHHLRGDALTALGDHA